MIFLLIFSEFISVKELGDAYLGVFLTNLKVNVIAKVISFITIFILFYISTLIIGKIEKVLVSGPKRELIEKTNLDWHHACPGGDVMMTGTVGLIKTFEELYV